MESDMTKTVLRLLTESVKATVVDKELCGRLTVDVTDILEACEWYVRTVGANRSESLSRDELETLLIEIDVNLIQHLSFHLESLRKDLSSVLDAIALTEDKNEE